MTRIVQIVPRLPPSISGVGDYAFLLASELRRAHDIQTTFVLDESAPGNAATQKTASELDGFKVLQVKARNAEELLRLLLQPDMPQTVVLQYVGYGFEKRGYPVWLVNALREWKRGAVNESRTLVTMFHELYARRGAIWTSSFWNSLLQRKLATQLTEISDLCWTNRNHLRAEIEQMASRHVGRIRVLPVFSNFGEQENPIPLAQRKPQAVFFGGFGRGLKDESRARSFLKDALANLGIQRLLLGGTRSPASLQLDIPMENLGNLSAAQGDELLRESRIGVLDYFDGELAKSGIFAAYCAHGLMPLLIGGNDSVSDGVQTTEHFLTAAELKSSVSPPELQRVATRAREWYAQHNLSRTASLLAEDVATFQSTMAATK